MNQDSEVKSQVKKILKVVEQIAPGKLVELRIPPYAAIQCVDGGNHRRGTPPNVVEMAGETLINLAEDPAKWETFCNQGLISASGTSSDLSKLFTEVSKLVKSFYGGLNGQ
jgi:hypothetical protein